MSQSGDRPDLYRDPSRFENPLKAHLARVTEDHITLRVLHSAGRPDGPYVAMLATVALRTSMGSRRRSAPGI